jgi:hypothetical protein
MQASDRNAHRKSGIFAMGSQVHEGCVVACAMKRGLGPIFNAATDISEQALGITSLAELVCGGG